MMIINIIMMIIITITTIITKIIKEARIPDMEKEAEEEGNYLYGKKWNGKGKEYYQNGIIKYEGEYINGKQNREGKEYDM